MENIEIPEDFYIDFHRKILFHKKCVIIDNSPNNYLFVILWEDIPLNKSIMSLRDICKTHDEIEEKTYFVNCMFDNLYVYIASSMDINLANINFTSVNNFLEYLTKNYPESVKGTDIKIALKD